METLESQLKNITMYSYILHEICKECDRLGSVFECATLSTTITSIMNN